MHSDKLNYVLKMIGIITPIFYTEDNKIIWFVLNLITPQVTFQTQYPTFFYCMLLNLHVLNNFPI